MANQAGAGRMFLIKKNGTAIAGLRAVTITVNSEPIDISSYDDEGVRTLLDAHGKEITDLSGELVMKEETFRVLAFGAGNKLLTDITVEFIITDDTKSTPANLAGNFYFSNFTETGSETEAVTGSIQLLSSGRPVYTPEAV